ncbi:hypothetical protein F5J12DRAFT_467102 [Pisolithus orientalis]|uniref:uncharacterized protein n=1 Tax=Pisolithus orientalis TaxID=936130 RepID=UPI002224F8DF|nr:uncharacterized protein F5J12DRAFT_467102 [Pisolithus orientalis]KAI5991707.1 hypothetical protein F5J12DRAFT_467102 [Pisolithus orientalis]
MLLTLSSENVRNATFMSDTGQPLYVSSTPFRFGRWTTKISKYVSDDFQLQMEDRFEAVGKIRWPIFGSAMFRIGGKDLRSDSFLRRHGITGRKRTFKGPDDRRYRWDMHRRIVVLSLDGPSRREVARYRRSTFGSFNILGVESTKACLEISQEVEHMLDLVILTFIYMEKLRMDREWWEKLGRR